MAAVSHGDSKRKYSWWWDSHISPKNSKWLQENLTDMDLKVKQMIKLIEEDADSFARRAEMYYKKRPELMKLVEEFYRAYRALAERYDHATGALRQAQRTMAEAFPNQVPFMLTDDSPAGSADGEPRTPDMPPIRALFDPDELKNDALGISPSYSHAFKRLGAFTEESDSVPVRKSLKQFNDLLGTGEARARKGLSFHDAEEKDHGVQDNDKSDIKSRVPSDSQRVGKAELEIATLKDTLAKLEAEKEAGLLQYQQSLQRLSNLESEVSRAKEDSKGLNERASKAEAEVQTLKEALTKLEAEREASLLQYQQCLDKITNLENIISHTQKDAGELNERASKAEVVVQSLEQELANLEAEKEEFLYQYKECLEKISDLEGKLLHAEDDARKCYERADKAEREVETLKEMLAKLTEENEATATQYQKCLDTISSLEQKLAFAQEEAQRLKSEVDDGVVKLKGAEEKCLLLERSNNTMHSELESLAQKMSARSEELTEKQQELGRLWTCIQEERLRFVEAETAFQTLQHLHSQSQEELRSMAAELQNRARILQDLEARNQSLQHEVEQVKVENKGLSEVNLSSNLTIQDLQEEISNLRQTIGRLEAEVELRLDQRNALQQEIYCLKEELNDINKKNQAIMDQVDSVGLSPECLGSSVKSLQDENIKLKEVCARERDQNVALLQNLEIMEKLAERNALLENSLSDLNVELEGVREKVRALEESCQSLLEEKSTLVSEEVTLVSQLQVATDNVEKLTEKTNFLENSLFDANAEVEGLRIKSKSLQDLCMLLDNEKSDLATVKGNLMSQLNITQKRLEDLEKNYRDLEEKCSTLEKKRESTLHEIEELYVHLNAQKQEHASLAQLSESQLAAMATQVRMLQEEGQCIKKEHEEELDKAFYAQTEIFILQKCMQDLEEHNSSLSIEHQKLLEASKLSEKLISQLKHENLEQQVEVKSLYDKIEVLRVGLYRVLKTLGLDGKQGCEDKAEQDQMLLNYALDKLLETQRFLLEMQDENQQLGIENTILVTLLGELQWELANLTAAKNTLDQELASRSEQFLVLHGESQKLADVNEELSLKIIEGEHKEETLKAELKTMHGQLLDLQGDCQNLQKENCKLVDEQRLLMKSLSDLAEEKCNLEDENFTIFAETLSLSTISLIFKDIISEKYSEIKELSENLDKLHVVNNGLDEKVKIMEGKLLELSIIKDEKRELYKMVEDLKCKCDEVELIRADQAKQIIKLSGDCDEQSKEIECIQKANREMKAELGKLNGELLETKVREEILNRELQKGRNEAEWWESQAVALFGELQISAVQQALFEGKVHELIELCENLEGRNCLKAKEIIKLSGDYDEQSKEIECIQKANREMKAELGKLNGELLETKVREEILNRELQQGRNEAEWWESQAVALFGELQISAVQQALFEGKVHELIELCENLEGRNCLKAKEIIKLSGDCDEQSKEIECIQKANREMKAELGKLNGELLETKVRKEILNRELQKGRNEAEWWESQAIALFGELQISAVQQALFEGKVHELIELCENLEGRNCLKAKEIIKLSGDCDEQSKEIECIQKANREMKAELGKLNGELLETKVRKEILNRELQKGRNEAEWWESQAVALFGELQISAVQQALFEGKVHELLELCENLEGRNCLKAKEIGQMKERVSTLEHENEELKSQMTSYVPAFISLTDCIASLENHTLSHATLHEHKEAKDAPFVVHAESCQRICDDQTAMGQGGLLDVEGLRMRIIAIQEAVEERERFVILEKSDAYSKLAEAIRQIEELKSRSSLHEEAVVSSKKGNQNPEDKELGSAAYYNLRLQKPTHETSEEGSEVMTKDIMLDQMSESSSYGISRRETPEADAPMLEIWQTTEQDATIDLTVGKDQKQTAASTEKKGKKELTSMESMVEKDVSVDKLEISKRLSGSRQDVNERKILDRLDSDAQKLANLQITVQDLKRKVEITEKNKKGKGNEYDSVKEQLEESEEAITKMFEVNLQLMKSIEDEQLSIDEKSALASDENGSARKRRISEQARRGSEKIGRLQLEVQKLQFLLLKLDEENKSGGKTKIIESKTRVLLRDYLYGGTRTSQKKKKRHFCACVQPRTQGD